MSGWLSEVSTDVLKIWLETSPNMKLVCRADNKIMWANREFRDWSGYTLPELRNISWKDITKSRQSLAADIAMTEVEKTGYVGWHRFHKTYTKKDGTKENGWLYVLEYPPNTATELYLCTWEPYSRRNEANAFALAIEHIEASTDAVSGLTEAIRELTKVDEETSWVTSTIRMARKYPKTALVCIVFVLSLLGINNIIDILTKLQVLPVAGGG